MSVPTSHVPGQGELLEFTGVHLQVPVLCSLYYIVEFSACLPQRAKSRAAGQGAVHRLPSFFSLRSSFFKFDVHCLMLEQTR